MGARTKLNTVAVYGSLTLAGILGGVSQSWTVFFIVAGVAIVGCIYAGEIRIGSPRSTDRRN